MNYNFVSFVAAQNASTSRINMEGLPSGWTLQVGVAPPSVSRVGAAQSIVRVGVAQSINQSFNFEQPSQLFTLEQHPDRSFK